MSNVGKNGANPSLCWDCENCTKPNVCSWVRDFTPVDGWRAKKTRLGGAYPMDSYLVIECPLFNRSSYGAGMATDIMCGREDSFDLSNDDLKAISCAIIERYVEDWKFIDYGEKDNINYCGGVLKRKEILEFFISEWFADLLDATGLPIMPEQVWSALKITPQLYETIMQEGSGAA